MLDNPSNDRAPPAPETTWSPPTGEPQNLPEAARSDWARATFEIRELATARGMSKTDVARASGVPLGTFSPWYDGGYTGNIANITGRLRRWLDAEKERASVISELVEPEFVETPTAREVINALTYAQTAPTMVLVTLGAGMGKTTVAEHYCMMRPHARRVVMRPSTASFGNMLRAIARSLWVEDQSNSKLYYMIGEKLRGDAARKTLLILDEAQNLHDSAVNELRSYLDDFKCGIALLGNEEVMARWGQKQPKVGASQLHRRIGYRIHRLTPRAEDIEAYVAAWNLGDSDLIKLACAIGRKPGALGQIAESLKLAAILAAGAGRPMSAADLRQAWENRGGEAS
jgi:hypothetical protein